MATPALALTPDDYIGQARAWARLGHDIAPVFGPAYALLCGAVLGVGLGARALVLLNLGFVLVTVWATWRIVRGLSASASLANLAAALLVLTPSFLIYAAFVQPEALYSALLSLSLLILLRETRAPAAWRAPLLGAVLGLAALTRGNGLLAGALCVGLLLYCRRYRSAFIAGAVFLAFVGGWTVHNGRAHEVYRFTPSGDYNIAALAIGPVKEQVEGAPHLSMLGVWRAELRQSGFADHAIDRPDDRTIFPLAGAARRSALAWAAEHPASVARVTAVNQLKAWIGSAEAGWTAYFGGHAAMRGGFILWRSLLFALVAGGVAAALAGRAPLASRPLTWTLFALAVIAAHILPPGAGASARFAYPISGLAAFFAAIPLYLCLRRLASRTP